MQSACNTAIQQVDLLYGCIACRLHVCGPHTGQLTHSIVVLDAFMRPEMHFRPTRTPMTAMVGLYARHTAAYSSLLYARHTAAYSSFLLYAV